MGIFAPAGTPPDVVERLNREIAAVAKDPTVRARLAAQGNPSTQSPQAFRQKIADELKQNEALIKRANIKID
ncbi:Tripartite tricarboxylate transporter family receptor [compost metagenome]